MSSKYDDKLFKGASAIIFGNARELRKSSTSAEDLLWQELRNRKAGGVKFRRQHPINNYIADFYCSEKSLIVEVDGNIHNNQDVKEYDEARTNELNSMGIHVLRFTNDQVETNMIAVLNQIITHINNKQDS